MEIIKVDTNTVIEVKTQQIETKYDLSNLKNQLASVNRNIKEIDLFVDDFRKQTLDGFLREKVELENKIKQVTEWLQ